MNKKIFYIFALCVLVLTACTPTTSQTIDSTDDKTMEELMDEQAHKMAAEGGELTYSGPGKFVTQTETYPCAQYALESEICEKDPNGEVPLDFNFVQVPAANVNAELLSYLKTANNNMVRQDGEDYLINVGCKEGNQLKGDMYGTYDSEVLDEAFEKGSSHTVEFIIDSSQPGRDGDCLSLITEFKSIQ